jgi:DNA-binding transcriptional MerR regulator
MASIKQGVITAENQESLLLSSHRLFAASARTILKKQSFCKEVKTGYTLKKIRKRIKPNAKKKKL